MGEIKYGNFSLKVSFAYIRTVSLSYVRYKIFKIYLSIVICTHVVFAQYYNIRIQCEYKSNVTNILALISRRNRMESLKQ